MAFAAVLFLVIMSGGQYARAADGPGDPSVPYALGIGDTIAVKVLGRNDLSGEFVIGPSGQLALPLIGRIASEGSTLPELQQVIESRLAQATGMQIDTTVDIAGFRPFYILGNVRSPGAYPFVPRLTVLRAIALAGGELMVDPGAYQFAQDALTARKQIGVLKRRRDSLLASRARLEAEQSAAPEITFPNELESRPEVAEILRKEREIFHTRGRETEQVVQRFERQAAVFDEEIEALNGQREALERQIRLLEDDIAAIRDLVKRNLAPRPRLTEQQRARAELDRENRELGAFMARARQGHVNALESIKSHRAEQLRDIAVQLQDVNHELDQIAIELAGTREQAALASASLAQEQAASRKPAISRYVIVRPNAAGSEIIEAGPMTALRADDVLQVQIADGFDLTDPMQARRMPSSGAEGAPASTLSGAVSHQSANARIAQE
jgi:protein involved in polysaccharide export with SLBB domain